MRHLLAIAALATLGSATAANAVTIINGSFESLTVTVPNTVSGGFKEVLSPNSTAITGWTVGTGSGPNAGVDIVGRYWQPADGSYSLDLSGRNPGSVSQLLTGLTVGGHYTINFDLSGNPGGVGTKTVLVSVGALTPQSFSFLTGPGHNTRTAMNWVLQSYDFVATSSSQLLTFTSLTRGNAGAALDNVSISGGLVPEPTTWAMMLAGFGLVGFAARRRRTAAIAA